jgi:magnesium transporter
MLEPFLHVWGVDWFYKHFSDKEYIEAILNKYDLHELIEEDISEASTQDKVDVYDQCLFIVLHFPKYSNDLKKYLINEFNLILGKDYLVTLTKLPTNHLEKIKQQYETELAQREEDTEYKISPYYILYKIIDVMYDKVLRSLRLFGNDLTTLEEAIFDQSVPNDKALLEDIMIKRRNIVGLKHTIMPQQEIIHEIQVEAVKFYGGELDVYFEDLLYKIDKILSTISILHEDIDSLYDTHNAMVSMKTNTIVTLLTIFTGLIWMMTLITWWFGMNVPLPYADHPSVTWFVTWGMVLFAVILIRIFRKKRRIS